MSELSFADIRAVHQALAEVVVHEGVELDPVMVAALHRWLLENLRAPFAVLIDKKHTYSYTFEAQLQLGTLPHLAAIAVLAYDDVTARTTEALGAMPREKRWNMRVFVERDEALAWIEGQLGRA